MLVCAAMPLKREEPKEWTPPTAPRSSAEDAWELREHLKALDPVAKRLEEASDLDEEAAKTFKEFRRCCSRVEEAARATGGIKDQTDVEVDEAAFGFASAVLTILGLLVFFGVLKALAS